MQQVLSMQTGLYQYDEWMVQEINDKNLRYWRINELVPTYAFCWW